MFQIIVQGFIFGFILSFLIGPVFFLLLQLSITQGFKKALHFNLGVWASDIFTVFSVYFLLSLLPFDIISNPNTLLVGGIIFILFGAYKIILNYVKALSAKSNKMLNSSKHLVVSGILLNIFNPSVWVFWAATVSAVGTLTQHSRNLNLLFFIFCFATFIGIDLLKMYYASKLKKFITPKILKILNLIIGIGFCVVGFSLIFQYFRV